MPEFLIKPRFSALRNALYFDTNSLNAIVRAEYSDRFGFYQNQFEMYSYMQMNSDLDYVIHYPQGTPLMWQTHNSCAWTPTGTLSMGQKTVSPCKAKINEQYCYDEWFNSTYRAFLEWSNNPTIGMSTAGITATNELTRTIVKNATLGARTTLSVGQLHDLASVTFEDGASSRIRDAFTRTASTCQGWIQLVRALSATHSHLETGDVDAGDISTDGATYTATAIGSVTALYDAIFSNAPTALQDAIIEGGVGGFGSMFYPMFIVSPSIYRALNTDWLTQKTTAMVNEPRIEKRPYTVQTERGSRTIEVFFIDGTVVIPLHEVSYLDQYVTGTSHFAYLTLSGVIQLGSNFASLPVVNQSEVGVMMQMSEDAEDYGTHKFLAHALFASAINDTDYIAGSYAYAEPA